MYNLESRGDSNFRGRGSVRGGFSSSSENSDSNFRGGRGGRGCNDSGFRRGNDSGFRGGRGGKGGNDSGYSGGRGGRGGFRSQSAQRMYPIGVKDLEALLEREPYVISLELLKNNSGYDILLNEKEIRDFKMCLILKLLSRSVSTRTNENGTIDLLNSTLQNSNFRDNLTKFISQIKFETSKASDYLPLIGNILEHFIKLTPVAAFSVVSPIADLCAGAIQHLRYDGCPIVDKLQQLFDNLQKMVRESHSKWQKSRQVDRLETVDPPDNFRDLDVIPTCEEMSCTGRPFLRKSIVEGKYNSSDHYLDVQFRLLKEDFMRPLREGLSTYLNRKANSTSRNSDVRVYWNVLVDSTAIENGEMVYYMKLNLKKNFRIENSKRLMFGSILCISADNFETMVTASVKNRDKLDKKLLGVNLETDPYKLDFDKSYSIIESKAYFVAYKHTLVALQDIRTLPLDNYIVHVNETNAAPEYLKRFTTYEFDMGIQLETSTNLCDVCVLDAIQYWPSPTEMGFDSSQRRAIHGALTRQMAVIQGPPGTGKTFLGLHITKLLLHNKEKWSVAEKQPILVVCYTNHALDQFLEGITKITQNIVRVGARSKNEALQEYQINKRLFAFRRNYEDNAITRNYYAIRDSLYAIKSQTDFANKALKSLTEPGIITLDSFSVDDNPIPINLRSSIGSMRNFLVESFYKERGRYYQDDGAFLQHQGAQKPEAEEDVIDVDEDIMAEEEHDRILDDDDLDELNVPLRSLTLEKIRFRLEINPVMINDEMQMLEAQIDEDPYSLKSRALHEKLQLLTYELKVLGLGHSLVWNEAECKLLENQSIHTLGLIDRWKLYGYWKKKLRESYMKHERILQRQCVNLMKNMSTNKDMQYLNLMKKVDVVGMTTTGAAQYTKILHDLAPPIVIVEEAAEILEAHAITALSPECKHLILIGDHLQLRPKPNVYELGLKFGLNVSLFERMIKNGIQYETLEFQHRMKPQFSNLLVPTIYEDLKDHPSVMDYPKIKGVQKDLFFIDHNQFENSPDDDDESFENLFEAEFLMVLCRHLILQGYTRDDITIISPYTGQHRCLRRLQKQAEFLPCEGVRISILDNYQGEESNIILLSLVRSNEQKKVGFVKIENRICVALSRAKHGMYIIGNMSQMTEDSSLWRKIKQKLVDGENIGPALQLQCQNHPNEIISVGSYSEFRMKSPEGGCKLKCSSFLPNCNHACPRLCHVFDNDHEDIRCSMPCPKILCKREHPCPDLCSATCKPCTVKVLKQLPCSHTHSVPCSTRRAAYKCPTMVNKTLPHCKHVLNLPCHVNERIFKCSEKCTTRLDCGHQCKQLCHALKDPDHDDYACHEQCERKPEHCIEKHKCKKMCYEDCGACVVRISRRLACGHVMKDVQCGVLEGAIKCIFNCKRSLPCGHMCLKKCSEPCGGCLVKVDKVVPSCQHTVKIPCKNSPTKDDCSGNCINILSCGHKCKRRCKDPCTDKCMELVQCNLKCPKGHIVKIPCRLETARLTENIAELGGKTVGEYCTEVCGAVLGCDHRCKGKCGECYNGRLHNTCKEDCKKVLVCGHVCKSPCSVDCPPCQEPCLWKCIHSACGKKCGFPCTNCMQKCRRSCAHSECTAKCGQKCNINSCTEPCPLTLPNCGHPCIGFCGELCPPLCRVCDYETVTTILFGDEDEPDARFVVLEDCKHVFEAGGLETWLNSRDSATSGAVEIGMKKCPDCSRAIYNTKRYQNEILKSYENVLQVKRQHFVSKEKFNRNQFKTELKALQVVWRDEIWLVRDALGFDVNLMPKKKQKQIGDREYELYRFQLSFLKGASATKEKLGVKQERLKDLVALVMKQKLSISSQMMDEITCELRRLEISISVEKVRLYTSRAEVNAILGKIDAVMDPTIKFDGESEKKVIGFLHEAERYMGSLGISNSERLQIVQAIGLSQGHWFKCPNGHIYAIGECGGAVMEAKCPECKAAIGGGSHRLRGDNRVATEMDGATSSAYPGAAYI